MNEPESHSPPLPRPPQRSRFTFEPMTSTAPGTLLETLLKHPGRILYELQREERPVLFFPF